MAENENPDPTLDEAPPAPSPADDARTVNEGATRFAIYDKDELRYRGIVHDTRKGADDLKAELGKGKRRGRFEVREVS